MIRLAPLTLALAVLAAGCGADRGEYAAEEMAADVALSKAGAARPAVEAVPPAPAPGQVLADSAPPSMLIRTGRVALEVDAVDPALAAAQQVVTRLGGHVTEVSVQGGGEVAREAHLVARVPAERFDEALAGLESVGEVEAVEVTAQDVGEEYVDVAAQLRNRQRLEQRLLELLETRTGRLEDVLAVERELARVREEIERQEGRLRYLRNRVSLSTLYITLREPAPLLSTSGGQNVFAHAVRSAWRNFLDVIVFLISAVGVIIPLAVVAWLLWKPARWWRRRRRAPDA